ncbi:hypothetical protein ACOL3B_10340 [Aliarcobacter butzleri]
MNIASNKKKKIKKIFLSTDMKINEPSKVDIILSPEFYWVRIFELPVKNISQVKSIVPSLFEDLIEDNKELSYKIIKLDDNKYLCFAYINQKIFEKIKNSGINLSLINNVYFAQNECKSFSQFIINNKSFLYTRDDILVKVPNEVLSEKFELEKVLEKIELSNHKIDIKLYNNSLNKNQINLVLFCCLLILLVNISKYFLYSNEISKIDTQIENMKSNSKLPSSMIQINAIFNSNEKILQKEISIREALYYILSNNKFVVNEVFLDQELLNINFQDSNKDEVKKYIEKKYKIDSIDIKESNLNIKVQL